MKLRILQVAYPFAPVTADPVGGAEQILAALDRAAVAAGHESIVIAEAGSRVAGRLVPLPALDGEIDDAARAAQHARVRAAIARVCAGEPIDLIHLHGIDFYDYLPAPGVPTLATLHLPLGWYPAQALAPRPGLALVPVSRAQAATAPAQARLLPPIENGVDLAHYRPQGRRHAFFLCLGRICPEKGFDLALDAARMAGVPLLLAGEVFAYGAHRDHFRRAVRPRLDARRRFLGPVTGPAKRRLIAAARAVVVPSRVAETSSLVAREALACGTPVIASPRGALPEIILPGQTGLLADTAEEIASAMARIDAIDGATCRAFAERRFPLARMCADYLNLYARHARAKEGVALP